MAVNRFHYHKGDFVLCEGQTYIHTHTHTFTHTYIHTYIKRELSVIYYLPNGWCTKIEVLP